MKKRKKRTEKWYIYDTKIQPKEKNRRKKKKKKGFRAALHVY